MTTDQQPAVSVVLPVYNQADHIDNIVTGYLEALDNLRHSVELVLVVNGDRDGSWDRCQGLAERYAAVQALENRQPGWGRAVKTGLSVSRGQLLCYTNSARTSAHILALHIMLAMANPGLVIKANRRLRHPFVRRMGSVFYNVQCRTLFDLPVWDVNGTPKVFRREALQALDLKEDGDLIDLELVVKCKLLGLQMLEVPIVSEVRHGGESTTNYASAIKMYWGAFCMWRDLPVAGDHARGK